MNRGSDNCMAEILVAIGKMWRPTKPGVVSLLSNYQLSFFKLIGMKKIIIVLLFISKVISLPGQSTNIDSLQKALAVSKEDTNRVLLFQDVSSPKNSTF